MRTQPVVLAAGIVSEIALAARYFRLMATTGPVDVSLMQKGRVVYEAINVEAGFWAIPDGGFDGARITSATSQTIQIASTLGNGGYDRSAGSVQITNAVALAPADARWFKYGDYEAQQAQAFVGTSQNGPVAAQVPLSQLWNPAGSGRLLYVDLLETAVLTAADRVQLYVHNAALGATVATISNKRLGGAAKLAQLRGATVAAPAGTLVRQTANIVNGGYQFVFDAPFVIPEGFGVHAVGFTVNTSMSFSWEWREKTT